MLNAFLGELPDSALTAAVIMVASWLAALFRESFDAAVAGTAEDLPLWVAFVVLYSLFKAWRATRRASGGAV